MTNVVGIVVVRVIIAHSVSFVKPYVFTRMLSTVRLHV